VALNKVKYDKKPELGSTMYTEHLNQSYVRIYYAAAVVGLTVRDQF